MSATASLVWKLRTDPRVVVHERTNARYLNQEAIVDPIGALVRRKFYRL